MGRARVVERVWWGTDPAARIGRGALAPAAALYGAVVAARSALYDAGVLATHPLALPAVSVGNLTVGGTGKTPVSAWIAAELARRGARPAIVLRGYGDDEPLVHAALNPDVPVVVSADRVAGAERARRLGADVAVLDDAFQHRRASRVADVLLVSADRWAPPARLLPAGPWREPLRAARRASIVVVTRKAASPGEAVAVLDRVRGAAPGVPGAVVHLAPDALVRVGGGQPARAALDALRGERVLVVSAIGDPDAFVRQVTALGAEVARCATFDDHHAFSPADAGALAALATGVDRAVCTLKDAVKLGPLWPREAPPLWYVSQRAIVERARAEVDRLLDRVLAARSEQTDDGRTSSASPT